MRTIELASLTAPAPTYVVPASTPRRRSWGRRLARALGVLLLVLAAALLCGVAWLATGDNAEEADLALALATYAVTTSDDGGVLTIASTASTATDAVGVAFLPGTRIERDAYVATWAPIVEATGITVHIAAVPLNLPVLADDPIGDIMAAHPETSTWIVGGHSMGGFEAAAFAAGADVIPAGLLLWASGPAESDLAETDVPTLIVAGAKDTVVTLERYADEALLAVDTTIEIIDGMVHGQFGRYSDTEAPQDPARRSDADTLADLVAITSAYLDQIAASAS